MTKMVEDQGKNLEVAIKEVTRIGKFVEGGLRPLRGRFNSQTTAKELVARL